MCVYIGDHFHHQSLFKTKRKQRRDRFQNLQYKTDGSSSCLFTWYHTRVYVLNTRVCSFNSNVSTWNHIDWNQSVQFFNPIQGSRQIFNLIQFNSSLPMVGKKPRPLLHIDSELLPLIEKVSTRFLTLDAINWWVSEIICSNLFSFFLKRISIRMKISWYESFKVDL